MINYNWNCKTVDAYPKEADKTDVVYNVHWIVTGVSDQLDPDDNPYTARIIGTQLLDISDITGFIPFDQQVSSQRGNWLVFACHCRRRIRSPCHAIR